MPLVSQGPWIKQIQDPTDLAQHTQVCIITKSRPFPIMLNVSPQKSKADSFFSCFPLQNFALTSEKHVDSQSPSFSQMLPEEAPTSVPIPPHLSGSSSRRRKPHVSPAAHPPFLQVKFSSLWGSSLMRPQVLPGLPLFLILLIRFRIWELEEQKEELTCRFDFAGRSVTLRQGRGGCSE